MTEIWKPAPSYPGYLASSVGRIIGKRGAVMSPWLAPDGYMKVTLHVAGRQISIGAHRIICDAFLGPRPSEFHQVAHYDGDRTNNSAENLRWATAKENCLDKKRHGSWPSLENHPRAQLTVEQVSEIRRRHNADRGPGVRCRYGLRKVLAQEFGVGISVIKDILADRSWSRDTVDGPGCTQLDWLDTKGAAL